MFEHTRDYERCYPALSPVVCIILLLEGSHLLHAPLSPMLLQQRSPMHCCTSLPIPPIQQEDITSFHSHRMAWVGRDPKVHRGPTPSHRQGHQPPDLALDQVAQGLIQPGLFHVLTFCASLKCIPWAHSGIFLHVP